MSGSRPKKRAPSIGPSQALRDVLIASINKGQFPVAALALILILALMRMPDDDVSRLMFRLLDLMESGRLGGYVLWAGTLAGWLIHSRFQRRTFTAEMERVVRERTELQVRLLGNRVKSSEGR
jgi:hypothetical protein